VPQSFVQGRRIGFGRNAVPLTDDITKHVCRKQGLHHRRRDLLGLVGEYDGLESPGAQIVQELGDAGIHLGQAGRPFGIGPDDTAQHVLQTVLVDRLRKGPFQSPAQPPADEAGVGPGGVNRESLVGQDAVDDISDVRQCIDQGPIEIENDEGCRHGNLRAQCIHGGFRLARRTGGGYHGSVEALFIETFYGGSHRAFADQWTARSRHRFDVLTLSDRFWKWRQIGSALWMAETLASRGTGNYEVVVISGMIDIGHLRSLVPSLPPVLYYVHENQFTYPLSDGESRDYRYGMVDLVNILSADHAVFNSDFNRRTFFDECRRLMARMPDAVPKSAVSRAEEASSVVHPGLDIPAIRAASPAELGGPEHPAPLVIWNHRHEHDKDPDTSFAVLERLARDRIDFRLALLGERSRTPPPAIRRARRILADRIVVDAYPSRPDYLGILAAGSVVVSSALQENFGIAVAEAVAAGCHPVLPRRLAYPEVIPEWAHASCLWTDVDDYYGKLREILEKEPERRSRDAGRLAEELRRYDWSRQAALLDGILETIA